MRDPDGELIEVSPVHGAARGKLAKSDPNLPGWRRSRIDDGYVPLSQSSTFKLSTCVNSRGNPRDEDCRRRAHGRRSAAYRWADGHLVEARGGAYEPVAIAASSSKGATSGAGRSRSEPR